MKEIIKIITLIVFFLIISGCSSNITENEAQDIALKRAKEEGYINVKVFNSSSGYAVLAEGKHIKSWMVDITTSEHPYNLQNPIARYFIDIETGEIVQSAGALNK